MSSITISTTNTYPVFESNQVLTSSQLNQLLDYLDRQSRFTRSKLIGIGIVCGMQVKYQPEEQAPILISKGVGVTSDGFVINVPECPVRYIRNYLLPEGVDYKPFGCFDENDLYYQDVNLYELLVKEPDDPTGVTEIDTDTDFLDDKYVVMFLECFDRDFKSCLGKNCDENGKERIFTLRKLLISQADLDKVLLRSDGLGNPYVDQEILPTVAMPRPIFLPEENHSQQYVDFAEHYRDLLAGTYVELFGSSETDGILPETYTQYEPVLGAHYNYINPIESSTIDALKDTWRAYYTEADTSLANYLSGIQHFYDFLKDVVLAYDEFRKAAYDLISECCPSRSFPLHLMLGKVIYDDGQLKETDEFDVCSPFNYRHTFLQPEIFNGQKHLKNTVINLHKRLVLMLENFNLDTILNSGDQMIKTTPSNEKLAPLADRSIPYYYDINTNGTVKGVSTIDLEKSWNFDARRRGCPGGVEIVSYTKNDVTQDTHQDPITTPLLYNLDGHPFFRIEGHFGKAYTDVQTELEDLKKRFNLSFDVTAVKLDTTTGSIVLDDCYWDDQQAAYSAARSEMICVVNNLNAQWTDFVNEWNAWLPGSELPGVGLNTTFDVINIDVINEILALLPTKISDFDFGAFKGVYDKLQFDLGAYLLSAQHTFNSLIQEKSGVISLSTLEEALSMLNAGIHASNAFYSNCTYIKLFTQYHNYVALLAYMQENHWSVFSNFIKTHPGIDHQIGVPKGGTFLLVYKGDESETTNQVIADFTLPYTCCDTCPDIPGAEDLEVTYPPSARPEMIITTVNQDVIIDVKANDLDINVENLRITEKGSEAGGDSKSAQGGDVLFNDGRRFLRYVPPNNFTGEDQFQYTIDNEDSGLTDTTFVRVLVVDPYTPHIKAVGDLAATDSATSILIEVTNNDTFYGTTQVVLPSSTSKLGASLQVSGNNVRYTPAPGIEGKDIFAYVLEDGTRGESVQAEVEVIVYCCDRTKLEMVYKNRVSRINILTPEQEEAGAQVRLVNEEGKLVEDLPTEHGFASVIPNDGQFREIEYTPTPEYIGEDKVEVAIINQDGTIDYCTLLIIVQDYHADFEVVIRDTAGSFRVTDNSDFSLGLFINPDNIEPGLETEHGTAKAVEGEGGIPFIEYTPEPGYVGKDSFGYVLRDGSQVQYYEMHVAVICPCDGQTGFVVTGTVTNEENSVIPGVTVTEIGTGNTVTTSSSGTYTIQVPQDAGLRFARSGYKTVEIGVDGQSIIDVEMSSTSLAITGFVLDDSTNEPINNARVAIQGRTVQVFTRDDGSYSITADSIDTLVVSAQGYQTQAVDVNSRSNINIRLIPQVILVTGTVRDITGQPLPGVNVIALGGNQGATTDFSGRYSINVPAGAVLRVSTFGFIPNEQPVSGRSVVDFALRASAVVVNGFVRDNDGNPVSSATVSVQGTDKTVTTDDQGAFNLDEVPSNATLVSNSPGFVAQPIALEGRTTVDLTLKEKSAVVAGRIINQVDGAPIAAATVRQLGTSNSTVSNASGEYSITVPMNAILLVSAVGFGSREAPVNNQLNLDLFLGGENVAVKGNVTDPNGQPVAGAKVVESGNPANTTTTNDQGTFEIDVPSDATLLVTAAGFAPSQSPVQGKAEQNIQLFPTT